MLSLLLALLIPHLAAASDADPRVRQQEAKIRLRKIFEQEKAAFARDQRFTTAISHFEDTDQSANGPRRYYTIGVPDACAAGGPPDANISLFSPTELSAEQKFQVREYFRNVPAADCAATGFRVFAVGIIADAGADVWTIDQDRELVNVRWGIPETTGVFARVWRVMSALWGSP